MRCARIPAAPASGAARLAWSAAQAGTAVRIVPLGLNYERKERFRSSVWVRVGEPLDGANWFRTGGGEERKAIEARWVLPPVEGA